MTYEKRKILLFTLLVASVVLVGWLALSRRRPSAPPVAPVSNLAVRPEPAPAKPVPVAASTTPVAAPQASSAARSASAVAAVPGTAVPTAVQSPAPAAPPAQFNQAVGTAQMYAAHAPLRVPEIADPDSTSNRQILQAMINKALTQPAQPPPSSSRP